MEYALTQPAGLTSLTVADSPASMLQWVAEANRLRADLPPEVQQTLLRHEEAGMTDDPAYEQALEVFYRRHVSHLDPCTVRTCLTPRNPIASRRCSTDSSPTSNAARTLPRRAHPRGTPGAPHAATGVSGPGGRQNTPGP